MPDHLKILVVNDDPASLLALTSLLDQWAPDLGYKVMVAASGHEALRQVLLHDFAVILLDVNMPGMDGFETADAIQQHPRSADVPIIFVTAYQADEIARLKAYQRGAADFLFTPIIPQVLRAKVSVFVALGQKNEQLRRQTAKLGQRTAELTAINRRLTGEMEERHAAERASHAKDEFLAMLGHELRNPLSAIGSAASLLGMPAVSADAASRARNIIQRQSQQLASIVDDLLDLSRAMAGKIILSRRPLDLAALVGACLDTFRASGRTCAHQVTQALEPCWVDGDPTRLEQVISNLIDNGIKYTPPGGKVHVTLRHRDGEIELSVSDDGIGISTELLPQIFDIFVQASSALDRAQGGLGIGLSLVRRLVELHEGAVGVDSAGLGQGATFTVRLPPAQPAEALPLPLPREPGQPVFKPSVLLVDDNNDGREMLALALHASGYEVCQSEDGTGGLALAESRLPQIALVDIGLPGIDGYEVARRLRSNPVTRDIRLVALTGYGLAKDQAQALEAGFDLHLVKPVNVPDLLVVMSELCGGTEPDPLPAVHGAAQRQAQAAARPA